MQRLQRFEIGISSTFQQNYARYNKFGTTETNEDEKISSLTFGAGIRLSADLQAYALIPLVHQSYWVGSGAMNRLALGDIQLGARYLILDSLFQSDWYPNLYVESGLKFPTGKTQKQEGGFIFPSSGNDGYWEPYLGLGVSKSYGSWNGNIFGSYLFRIKNAAIRDGDLVQLVERLRYSFSPRLSVATGMVQEWGFETSVSGIKSQDSHSKSISAFVGVNYFLDQVWLVAISVDSSLSNFLMNRMASRSVSLTMRYGFF